jgi:hypothetical protein
VLAQIIPRFNRDRPQKPIFLSYRASKPSCKDILGFFSILPQIRQSWQVDSPRGRSLFADSCSEFSLLPHTLVPSLVKQSSHDSAASRMLALCFTLICP